MNNRARRSRSTTEAGLSARWHDHVRLSIQTSLSRRRLPSRLRFAVVSLPAPGYGFPNFMEDTFTIASPAKTNLSLRVLGRREDGFHEIETRMCLLSLEDELVFTRRAEGEGLDFVCDDPDVPTGEENLVIRAVRAFEDRVETKVDAGISLTKRIPLGAGLGGGSSNAAASLRALDAWFETALGLDELLRLACGIGSDVAFFLHGGACECRGRGELVAPLAFDWELPVVLVKPPFGVATPWAYGAWQDSRETPGVCYAPQLCYWGAMVNDLERPVFSKYLVLAELKMWLMEQQETHAALLSGSGSTMLVVLSSEHSGEALTEKIRQSYGEAMWTHVGHTIASSSTSSG
ncbi:MAG: 4-(cytidine 5'-diphospho)-2-C-methyl-D-erythritol kinase [Verrucomicrobiales bacterium]